jgi:copper chaperone CopZ
MFTRSRRALRSRPAQTRPGRALLAIAALACAGVVALGPVTGCKERSETTATPVSAPADAVTLQFEVEGMHCTGCEKAIEGALAKLPGVQSCDASFEEGLATVVASGPGTSASIIEAIDALGYDARPSGETIAD